MFLSVFPFFSSDFRGSARDENPCVFGGFSLPFSKTKQGKEGQRGIPKTGILQAGTPKLGIPKTGRFRAPLFQVPIS